MAKRLFFPILFLLISGISNAQSVDPNVPGDYYLENPEEVGPPEDPVLEPELFPEEQILNATRPRTWSPNGTRLGMPGLANIWAHDGDHPHYTDFIPTESDDVIVVPLKHDIRYAGSTYKHLTIASGARIFLGNYENYKIPADGVDGSYPYVKPIIPMVGDLIPAPRNTRISVAWRNFDEHGDEFTVLEIGPFLVDFNYRFYDNSESRLVKVQMLCQVSFYNDGEIQVQYWIQENERSVAHSINPSKNTYSGQRLGFFMNPPYVYNGAKRIQKQNLYGMFEPIKIFDDGKLREGWIAKSFQADDLKFDVIDGELEINFGTKDFPGAVLAYDHARENPIVGSFQQLEIQTKPVYVENAYNNDPIYLWYFNESGSFFNQTEAAGYPYLDENAVLQVSDKMIDVCMSLECVYVHRDPTIHNRISPATYSVTWNEMKKNGINVDTIPAPALKIQVDPKNTERRVSPNRTVRIKEIKFSLVQPASIQFKPPVTKELKYDGAVGYLEVAGRKAPLQMPEGANVEATIHSTPGYVISKIEVNGGVAYDENNPSSSLPDVYVNYSQDRNTATIRLTMDGDKKVSASYRFCTQRKLPEVIPSYVKNEIFLNPMDKSKVVTTYSIKDGFDRVVQTQEDLDNGRFSVSAQYFDYAGNAQYAPKTFVVENKSAYSFEKMHCWQCVTKSGAFYNGDTSSIKARVDAFGYPYTEHNYHYGENKAIVGESAGMGEASFKLGTNFVRTWKIPIATYGSDEFFTIDQLKDKTFGLFNGSGAALDNEYLGRLTTITEDDLDTSKNEFDYPYVLTINQALDGSFSQTITDGPGNVWATWIAHDDDVLISRNVYDPNTSLLDRSYVEGRSGFEKSYEYDFKGRLLAVESPDRGRSEMRYDLKNRIRFTRNAKQIAKGGVQKDYFNIFVYDDQDRVVQMGEVRGGCSACFDYFFTDLPSGTVIHLLSETIYGKPTVNDLRSKSSRLGVNLATDIVNSIEGVSSYDVGATISYDGKDNVNTMKFSSFDRLGRLKTEWTVYLFADDAPAIKRDYEYTSSGQIARTVASEWDATQNSWTPLSKRVMAYGPKDRLENIYEQDATDDTKKWELARYSYDAAGSLESTTYFDKDQTVYTKSSRGDIYGRATRIRYGDAAGNDLYVEELGYSEPHLNRVSTLKHTWMPRSGLNKVVEESFDYDDLGHLTTFNTDMASMTRGQYSYDILGRMTAKSEAGSSVVFGYVDGSYQPASISINGVASNDLRRYDVSGNVWLDQRKKYAYSLNSFGLPDRIRQFSNVPLWISLDNVDGLAQLPGEIGHTDFLYDENGRQIWKHEKVTINGVDYEEMKIPGVGEYYTNRHAVGGALHLSRVDLVAGGFRLGSRVGSAVFPVTDAQGNIRGFATIDGLESVYGYYPYGTPESVAGSSIDDSRRWQGKEFDIQQDKYDFGARYYDPFLGLWMSPDPAGQFANSYSYGGDPINYIDPTGMWSFGIGLVVSWDTQHGWGIGIGASTGDGNDLSYVWHEDGSDSFNATAGGSYQFYAVNLNAGVGYSYNSVSGKSLTAQGGACIGNQEVACAGGQVGGGAYWDGNGEFMGTTAYAEAYATAAGGLARVSSGYEKGFMGMEGRGGYAAGSLAGIHAEWSERGGWSGGFRQSVYYGVTNNGNELGADGVHREVSRLLLIPELGSLGHIKLGASVDETKKGLGIVQKEKILETVESIDKNYAERLRLYYGNGTSLTESQYKELTFFLETKAGLSNVWRPNASSYHKDTYAKGIFDYGNLEFKYMPGCNNVFSSYNHGNNVIDHIFLDMIGYLFSN